MANNSTKSNSGGESSSSSSNGVGSMSNNADRFGGKAIIHIVYAKDEQSQTKELTGEDLDKIAGYANKFLKILTLDDIIEFNVHSLNSCFDNSVLGKRDGVAVIGMTGLTVSYYTLNNVNSKFAKERLFYQKNEFGKQLPPSEQFYHPDAVLYPETASLGIKSYGNTSVLAYERILNNLRFYNNIDPLIAAGFTLVHALGHNVGLPHGIGLMSSGTSLAQSISNMGSIFKLTDASWNADTVKAVRKHFTRSWWEW